MSKKKKKRSPLFDCQRAAFFSHTLATLAHVAALTPSLQLHHR